MPPSLTYFKRTQRGFSVTELLIVLVMVSVIAGFAVVSIVRGNRAAYSTTTAVEMAGYLQKARIDSMRRSAKDLNQMAQVKIFNRRFYSIAIDGDGDGNLDVPLVKSLPEQTDVEINGPFPKTYIFDWQGQTVDLQNNRVAPPSIIVGNSSTASAIKFGENGKVVVVPGVKPQPTP
jgi:prepilin-type N-terminal cleavage/methylation domain-containing protein